jgi:hypothetical protein
MRRRILWRADAGTRVYRGLQPGQGWLRRAGDAGERQSWDEGEVYGHGKTVCQLKNMVALLVEIPTFKSLDSSTHKGYYYK